MFALDRQFARKSRSLMSTVVEKAVHPLWAMHDHPAYSGYAKMFDRSQYLSSSALEVLQSERLRTQLMHAYRNIPFYRRHMEAAGVTPLDVHSAQDLKLLPILTKRDIQNNAGGLLAQNIPEAQRVLNQTGGSTGSPLQFWVDKQRFDSRMASTDRHNSWAGIRPGDWCAELWGSRLDTGPMPRVDWRQRFLYRRVILNTSVFSNEDLERYVELLRRLRPKHLIAYAQSAAMFARYLQKTGVNDIHFESVVTSAEMLLPEQRDLIEYVFQAQVFNRYGSREFSVIASECGQHTGMHVNADALIVEIEPIPGAPRGMGRVLVTDLLNRSMPLLRYEIGDLASWASPDPCPCGRSLPRLHKIEGRITDFLKLPDNTMISGISLALLIGQMPDIRQTQFVQRTRKEIMLRIVPGENYGSDTIVELRRRLDPYFRGLVQLSISCVDSIPCETSGKYRFVKTEAAVDELAASAKE